MADDGLDVILPQFTGPAVDLRVAKAVEGEAWLPHFDAVAAERIAVGRRGLPQRTDAQLAVLEDLRVPQGDRLAALPADADAEPAHEVLPEVDDRLPRRRLHDRHRRHQLRPAHGRPRRRDERRQVAVDGPDAAPPAVVVAWVGPSVELEARVVRLAVVQVGREQRSSRGAPAVAGRDDGRRPVAVDDLESREQGEPVAVDVAAASVRAEAAAVPPVAHDRSDRIAADANLPGHVERLDAQPAVVARPARCKNMIADDLAVDVRLVDADRSHVEPRRDDLRWDVELVPQ